MNLLLVGASYRTADVGLLERLATAPDDVAARLTELVRLEHVAEALLLSTCNRVEVYAAVSGFHGGVTDVSGWLAAQAGVEPAALAPHLYVRWDTEAVEHALRVGWPLDSERITCPLRIVWGTGDRLLPWPSAASRFRDGLPNADWIELEGVGHCPQLDVPLETAHLIAGFWGLSKNPTTPGGGA